VTRTTTGHTIERGLDYTAPTRFPCRAKVEFEVNIAVVKDLVCNYNCCEGECPCEAVQYVGAAAANGTVGVPWTGTWIFSGTMPIQVAVAGATAWMTVTTGPNYVTITGTPTQAYTVDVTVSATNCSGAIVSNMQTLIFFDPPGTSGGYTEQEYINDNRQPPWIIR